MRGTHINNRRQIVEFQGYTAIHFRKLSLILMSCYVGTLDVFLSSISYLSNNGYWAQPSHATELGLDQYWQ